MDDLLGMYGRLVVCLLLYDTHCKCICLASIPWVRGQRSRPLTTLCGASPFPPITIWICANPLTSLYPMIQIIVKCIVDGFSCINLYALGWLNKGIRGALLLNDVISASVFLLECLVFYITQPAPLKGGGHILPSPHVFRGYKN